MKKVCLWSGPRNVSTALMYSFAQRSDTRVVDEPLYGHYLRVTGVDHPGAAEVMAAVDCDGDAVMQDLLAADDPDRGVLFMKQMAHHLADLDLEFLLATDNVFLIRDPVDMLPSLTVQLPDAGLADTGLARQWQLYEDLERRSGQTPAVIDSRELLLDPESVLAQLCDHLEIAFERAMLSWPAGPRPEDGVWAPHWYDSVHRSTGFEPYRPKSSFPEKLRPLLDECRPYYDNLYARAIRGLGS